MLIMLSFDGEALTPDPYKLPFLSSLVRQEPLHFYIISSWQEICMRRLLKRLFVSYEVLDYRICILKGVSDGSCGKLMNAIVAVP